MKSKKIIIALCALAVSAVVAIVSAFTLDAKKCKGHDSLRGDFECKGLSGDCVLITTPDGSVECKGRRQYKDPLVIVVGGGDVNSGEDSFDIDPGIN